MSVAPLLSPLAVQRFVDTNGNALSGGLVYTYQAGTTTPYPTYTDATGDQQNANPVVLNQRGEAPIWLDPSQAYKIVLASPSDSDPPTSPIWTADNVSAALPSLSIIGANGSNIVGFTQSGTGAVLRTVQSKLRESKTPFDFGAVGDGTTDDTAALTKCDAACQALGVAFDGLGYTFAVSSLITLNCAWFRNVKLVPAAGYGGAAPTFLTNGATGVCLHDSVSGSNFAGGGANVLRGAFTGVHTFRARGHNRWINCGAQVRTTITNQLNTANTFVIPVANVTGFSVNDLVWIGDGQFQIQTIGTGTITLVNNGTAPTLMQGQYLTQPSGQFFTKDRNGANGLTIGDGTTGFNLDIPPGSLYFSNNGWSGLFHWSNAYAGTQNVVGVESYNNGFIGLGLGLINQGTIADNVCTGNSNNGIDTLESKASIKIERNVSRFNGVDGIYAGGNGEIPMVCNNDVRGNNRIGILLNGRTAIPVNALVDGNNAVDNFYRSITFTGIQTGRLSRCAVGGQNTDYSIWLEGSNSVGGLTNITVDSVNFETPASGSDLGGNAGSYVSGNNSVGLVNLIDPQFIGHEPSINVSNVGDSRAQPNAYFTLPASSFTASAGSPIGISINLKKILNTSVGSDRNVPAALRFSTDGTEGTTASVDVAARTAGTEISNDLSNFQCAFRFTSLSYNFTLNSAGTRYLTIEAGNLKRTVQLTWN